MTMQAPKPMTDDDDDDYDDEGHSRRKNKRKKGKRKQSDHDVEMEQLGKAQKFGKFVNDDSDNDINQATQEQKDAAENFAVCLSSKRKFDQFNQILDFGRRYRKQIKNDNELLGKMIGNQLRNGQQQFYRSKKLIKRTNKLIQRDHPLFSDTSRGNDNDNKTMIEKLKRRQDLIKDVFADIDDEDEDVNIKLSPAELRKIGNLPDDAPSQRPQRERKTNIDDDLWDAANAGMDANYAKLEDKGKNKTVGGERKNNDWEENDLNIQTNNKNPIDMDDIWEVTGALPPSMLEKYEDPYDAWKEDKIKPIQKPLSPQETQEYKDKMKKHFQKRRELLHRKYWLPRWCQWIVWLILAVAIFFLAFFFLKEGNRLGAQFIYIPQPFNNTNCSTSITEQQRFDHDYSLDESIRRNPACSPQSHELSMDNCIDYRVRFSIACLICFATSIAFVQPFYIFLYVAFILLVWPCFMPTVNNIREQTPWKKRGLSWKRFAVGGAFMISNDTVLEYGQINDYEDEKQEEDNRRFREQQRRRDERDRPLLND